MKFRVCSWLNPTGRGKIFLAMKETWDERYAGGKYSSAEPHRLLVELVQNFPPGTALDLACGAGRNAVFLAEKGFLVTAIDNSRVGLEIAAARAAEKGVAVDFRLDDLEAREFAIEDEAFDLICDFYFLDRELFPKIRTGVKIGGLVAAAIHIYGEGEDAGDFLLRESELREFFNDFEILYYHETSLTDTDAGEHHRRTAEILARRAF